MAILLTSNGFTKFEIFVAVQLMLLSESNSECVSPSLSSSSASTTTSNVTGSAHRRILRQRYRLVSDLYAATSPVVSGDSERGMKVFA